MKIYVPSYKRAGDVLTRKVIPDSILAIHEFEKDDYKEKEGGELLIIPDELRGNIAIGYHEDCSQHDMDYNRLLDFIDNGYSMCEELDCRLWGINLQSDPKFYRERHPITFLGAVLGTFSCHFKPELRYDEGLFLNEDYDFFLKNIKKYRKVLRFKKYYYVADHLNKAGGCGSYRLKDTEIEQAKIMQKRWGSKVFRFDINRSTNGIVNVPLKGI